MMTDTPESVIQHDIATTRYISNGIRDHPHGFDRRVHREFFEIGAAVFPHIGAIAPVLSQFKTIDMGCVSKFVCEDQLVA